MLKKIIFYSLTFLWMLTAEEKPVFCSDLLEDVLNDHLKKKLPDSSKWNIKFEGSYMGLKMLESNEADIGILALKSEKRKDLEKNPNYLVAPIAFQTFFIGVNTANEIHEIKVDVLKEIFSEDGMGKYTSWGEVTNNLQGNFLSEIYVLLSSNNIGIGSQLFKAEVLKGGNYNVMATVLESHQELSMIVSSNKNSLALFSEKPQDEKIRVLSIIPHNSKFSFSPSRENLFYSDYPYYLSIMLVCHKDKIQNFKELCQMLYSNGFFDEIEKAGFVGLSIVKRNRILNSTFGL